MADYRLLARSTVQQQQQQQQQRGFIRSIQGPTSQSSDQQKQDDGAGDGQAYPTTFHPSTFDPPTLLWACVAFLQSYAVRSTHITTI